MTKKLHELIELAEQGKKFKATHDFFGEWLIQDDFKTCESWSVKSILADWEYKELREPEVVEFELSVNDSGFFHWHQPEASMKLNGKKWSVVCTEVME